jgi:phage protein D
MGDVEFNTQSYDFDDLETKYRNFFSPAFEVLVDTKNILREGVAITNISVDTTVEPKADSFSFTVTNAFDLVKRDFQWVDQYFALGKKVEIKMGYTDKLITIFNGIITKVNFSYPSDSNPTITVTGMDITFLMMIGNNSITWQKKKYSDVVKEIAAKYTSDMKVDDTAQVIDAISQNSKHDFEFLTNLAKDMNYDFFVVGKTLYFRKPLKDMAPVVTLTWGKNLRSFSTEMNLSSQVSKVVVRGWEPKTQKVIVATADKVFKLGSNSKTGSDIMKTLGADTTKYIQSNVSSMKEAQDQADAALNKRAMEFISGDGESIGIPEIRAGRYIKLPGVGEIFNEPLYLTSVVHKINASGYLTSFKVRGNAI